MEKRFSPDGGDLLRTGMVGRGEFDGWGRGQAQGARVNVALLKCSGRLSPTQGGEDPRDEGLGLLLDFP